VSRGGAATALGFASVAVGLSFCGFNVYWLAGGTAGLDTIQSATAGPMPQAVMAAMTVIKVGRALLGLAAVGAVTRRIPAPLQRMVRILAWTAVAVLALRTGPFVITDIRVAAGAADPAGIAWFWNAWFAAWLAAFLPSMWLSKPAKLDSRSTIA
jgi:hypothetical protein